MRQLRLLIALLLLAVAGNAQIHQKNATWYEWKRGIYTDGLGIPADTLPVPLDKRSQPHLASKGDSLYLWSVAFQKWKLAGGGGGISFTPTYGLKLTGTSLFADSLALATRARLKHYVDSSLAAMPAFGITSDEVDNWRQDYFLTIYNASVSGTTIKTLKLYQNSGDSITASWTDLSEAGATDTTSLSARIDARVPYTDTAGMLSPYLRKIDTTGRWAPKNDPYVYLSPAGYQTGEVKPQFLSTQFSISAGSTLSAFNGTSTMSNNSTTAAALAVRSTATMAIDRGGILDLMGNDGSSQRTFGRLIGYKENGTSGDMRGGLDFYTSSVAGTPTLTKAARMAADGTTTLYGPLVLTPTNATLSGGNGAFGYSNSANEFQGIWGGVVRSFLAKGSDTVSRGKNIYVDPLNLRATDTRTGLGNYNATYPFSTIAAAAARLTAGDVLYIYGKGSAYTEKVVLPFTCTVVLDGVDWTCSGSGYNITFGTGGTYTDYWRIYSVNGGKLINTGTSSNGIATINGSGVRVGFYNFWVNDLTGNVQPGIQTTQNGGLMQGGSGNIRGFTAHNCVVDVQGDIVNSPDNGLRVNVSGSSRLISRGGKGFKSTNMPGAIWTITDSWIQTYGRTLEGQNGGVVGALSWYITNSTLISDTSTAVYDLGTYNSSVTREIIGCSIYQAKPVVLGYLLGGTGSASTIRVYDSRVYTSSGTEAFQTGSTTAADTWNFRNVTTNTAALHAITGASTVNVATVYRH